ncbi:cupin domain-containing protein [Trinickia sp. EG282A]|uniref:cupin domain-containing protein n=1 Tax=Trinickia sp. EG282A TaxID=3237013 RepID=UPI0034D36F59
MHIRRVVTGHDDSGRSVLLYDGPTPRTVAFQSIPGHAFAQVWTTPSSPVSPASGADPTEGQTNLLPEAGGTSLLIVTFPPDSTMAAPDFDPAAAGAECIARMPDLASTFEPDCPGMHTTDTVDYAIVLSGEIWLEVDDGKETLLRPTDVVVQQGTRHAWRNKSQVPALVAFFMIGASRSKSGAAL